MAFEEEVRAYKVHGRVQGVGFRWWVQRQGRQLGLRGSVRNCYDGTVEVVFAGPTGEVRRMSALLREGPSGARVDRLEEVPPPDDLPDEFIIGF